MKRKIKWAWMGRVRYQTALHSMERLAEAVRHLGEPGRVMLLEHYPTITLGRRAGYEALKISPEALKEKGIKLARSDRGGMATYHGPGQLVAYPVIDMKALGFGVEAYVTRLQNAVRNLLRKWHIHRTWTDRTRPGVWTQKGKIAAVGLRVRRGIATHGLALNMAVDKGNFDAIVPCGLKDSAVANVADFRPPPPMKIAADLLAESLADELNCPAVEIDSRCLAPESMVA